MISECKIFNRKTGKQAESWINGLEIGKILHHSKEPYEELEIRSKSNKRNEHIQGVNLIYWHSGNLLEETHKPWVEYSHYFRRAELLSHTYQVCKVWLIKRRYTPRPLAWWNVLNCKDKLKKYIHFMRVKGVNFLSLISSAPVKSGR